VAAGFKVFCLLNTVISNQEHLNTPFPMGYWAGFA
jgi:hypothetical protein